MDAETGRRSEKGAAEVPRHARNRWNRRKRLNVVASAASEKARQGNAQSLEALEIDKVAERIVERQMVLLWGAPHIALRKR